MACSGSRPAIENQGNAAAQRELLVRISRGGDTLYEDRHFLSIPPGAIAGTSSETRIPKVLPWSAETPHMYSLQIELRDATDLENNQFIRRMIGFRSVEIKDARLLVNTTMPL